MKKKVLLIVTIFILGTNIFASSDEFLQEISVSKKANIIKGEKEGKENIQTEFVYSENTIYEIYARMNYLMSIVLNPDEKINYIGGGDSARWIYSTARSGSSKGERDVIYIKPTSLGIRTNLIINTNKRSYNLSLISDKTMVVVFVKQFMKKLKQFFEY